MTLHWVFFLFLLVTSSHSTNAQKVIPHEPMSVVKSLLPKPTEEQLLLWKPFLTKSSNVEALVKDIEEHLKHLISSKAFVLSLDGKLLYEHFPPEMKWNTTHVIPYPNWVTFITTSLSILLEGYRPDILHKPLKELIQGSDLVVPKLYRSRNLLELLTTTPEGFEIETKHFLASYETRAYVAVHVITTILGRSLHDAWNDARMSLQLDNSHINSHAINNQKLISLFSGLYHFTEVVHSDLTSLPAHAPNELPYDRSEHYTFGWWVNGHYEGDAGQRLMDVLPGDTLISFSPTMQIFVIPSLKLSAVMVNDVATSWNQKTVAEILNEDNEIWRQLLMVTNSEYHDEHIRKKEKEEKERKEREERELPLKPSKPLKEQDGGDSDNNNNKKEEEKESDKEEGDAATGIMAVLDIVLVPFKAIFYIVFLYLDFAASQHTIVRIFLFIGFIVVGHAVVSGIFHTIWFFLRLLSSRTYQRRPTKMADKDD